MNLLYDMELFKRYWKDIIKNVFFLLVISGLYILGPLVLRKAVDYNAQRGFDIRYLGVYVVILTVLYVIKFSYNRFRFWFAEKFKNKETIELYKKVFRVSYEKINEMEPTYIAERVEGTVNTIFDLYSSSLSGIFVSGITILLVLVVTFSINPILALLFLVQIPLQYFGFQKLLNGENSKLSKLSEKLQSVRAKSNKNIKAIVSDVNNIKQFGNLDGLLSFIRRNVRDTNQTEHEGNRYAMDICTVLEYFSNILKDISYLYIIYLFVSGKMSVGDMVYLSLVNDIYYGSIGDVINIQINLRNLHGAMKFVTDEIEKNYETDGDIKLDSIDEISGELNNIGYNEVTLIRKGSFHLKKGDIVALTGESGTGKTTFVKLLNKFLECDGIRVNGRGLKEISNASLRSKVYYLSQASYLLPVTIRENITLGESVSKSRMEELCKLDFMQKFVHMEHGLDTLVYENASNLSGGDKQKIMLGRIFLKNPDVIILDESFNAMDEKTGEEIIDTIISMYSDRIIIIISHSGHYLKNCSKTVTIRDHKLIQSNELAG